MRGFARPDAGGRGAGNRGVRRRRWGWRARVGVALMTSGAVLAGCTATEAIREAIPTPRLGAPADPATVLAPTAPVPLAVAASAALYTSAPVVVLAADGDPGGQAGAASAAVALGAPMLLTPAPPTPPTRRRSPRGRPPGPQRSWRSEGRPGLGRAEGRRAGSCRGPEALAGLIKVDARGARGRPEHAHRRGRWSGPREARAADGGRGDRAPPAAAPARRRSARSPRPARPSRDHPSEALTGLVVLARSGNDQVAPRHRPCRRGAGGRAADAGPPGAAPSSRCCRPHPRRRCWRWAAASGPSTSSRNGCRRPHRRSAARRRPARVPGRRMVALYGTPGTAALGSSGEQDLNGSITRVKNLPAQFQPHSGRAGRPGLRDHHDGRGRTAGGDGDLLERGRDRQDPALRRRRRPQAPT